MPCIQYAPWKIPSPRSKGKELSIGYSLLAFWYRGKAGTAQC
jgi:hypothetical protein